ncbi:MAG TPA: gamma-glutamyl-phosphate reductase, partial [Pseudolabrys sp.]|nr:gamma-glutamyl-phosphate reductase [Pseudolabrys sp.]
MTAPLKTVDQASDIAAVMADIGRRARAAARLLALAPSSQKDRALKCMAEAIRSQKADILAANAEDVADARSSGASAAFVDRLALTDARIEAMAASIDVV